MSPGRTKQDANYAAALEEQRLGYERFAPRYDRLVGAVVRDERYREFMIQGMGLKPGARVLVLACGTGRDFEPLQRAIGPGGHITGVDLTGPMLEQARHRTERAGWANVDLIQADASTFVAEAKYDAAVCSFAMSVIPDYTAAFEAMVQALRPGGLLGIMDVCKPRSRLLLRVFHRFITWFLPEYDEDRPVVDLMEQQLEGVKRRDFYMGYIFTAWGRRP